MKVQKGFGAMAVTYSGPGSIGERVAVLLVARVQEFNRFLTRAGRAPGTIGAYLWALSDFVAFLRSHRVDGLEELSRFMLEEWQDRLLACNLGPRSRSLATTGVRQFLKWAGSHDYCDPRLKDWLTAVRLPPLSPKPLPPAAFARLVAYYTTVPVPARPSPLLWLRNRALFFYLVSTGARVSEALQVPSEGFERAAIRQKGGTEKVLVIPDSVHPIVRDYLAARPDPAPLLFISHPGGRPMTSSGVRAVWKKVAVQLGIAPFTTHQLRHTFATELLDRGVDAVTVAELLGHRNMQTIRNYAQVRGESRARAMRAIEDALHPPAWQLRQPRGSNYAGFAIESADTAGYTVALSPDVKPPADPRLVPPTAGRRGRPKFLLAWSQALSQVRSTVSRG